MWRSGIVRTIPRLALAASDAVLTINSVDHCQVYYYSNKMSQAEPQPIQCRAAVVSLLFFIVIKKVYLAQSEVKLIEVLQQHILYCTVLQAQLFE